MYTIQHCFIYGPLDITVSEDAGIENRTVATLALAVRCYNHSARSHLIQRFTEVYRDWNFHLLKLSAYWCCLHDL
jgi:hypothetical protein